MRDEPALGGGRVCGSWLGGNENREADGRENWTVGDAIVLSGFLVGCGGAGRLTISDCLSEIIPKVGCEHATQGVSLRRQTTRKQSRR